jgi:hypothetical protein
MGEAVNPKAYPLADASVRVGTAWAGQRHGQDGQPPPPPPPPARHASVSRSQGPRALTPTHRSPSAHETATQLSNTIMDIVQQASNYKQLRKGANEGGLSCGGGGARASGAAASREQERSRAGCAP